MKDEILLTDRVVKYKDHIRKIVEASTVHERNMFDRYFKAIVIFKKEPTRPIYCNYKGEVLLVGILIGAIITIFTFLI